MKKKSLHWLKLSCLSILLIVSACQQQEDQEPIPEATNPSQVRSASEIPGLLNAIAPYVNPSLSDRGDVSSANQANTYFGMSIDLEFVKSRIDSSNFTNYSMLLDDGIFNPRVIKNLVIGQDADGQWKTPMLMTYTMSEEFFQQYASTGALEGFNGTIRKEQLRPLSYQTPQGSRQPDDNEEDPDDYGSDRDQPNTTCPDDTAVSGGGGTTGTSTYTEVCEVFLVTVYSTDGHGNRYIHDQYLSYENCTVEEDQYTSSDSENCEKPSGEVPINENDFKPHLCNRLIGFSKIGNAYTGQINGLGLQMYRGWPSRAAAFLELGNSCVTVPAVNETAASILFKEAYNEAVKEFTAKLNRGVYGTRPTGTTLLNGFKQTILEELRLSAGTGASVVRFTTGACFPVTKITKARYCD